MRVPTYINEENYNIVNTDDTFTSICICNKLESGDINELYEIYFYGLLLEEHMICGLYDEENDMSKTCLIVAKCIHTGKEILLYDEAKYGYNPMFCDEINLEDIKNRPLSKLEIPNSKIEVDFAYNINFDEEKEDFEFDEDDITETINGEKISFEEVKKNGFDYIKITVIDELDTKRVICELELA
ncbi:hypothetical protein [Gemelliphila palaticanis]|uniref:Uncharacterized protein n=1 Tax=Gemelliphila palaticanis TaxID=81950 RepID=A0ABX2SZ43_9BACL|nr:hypothetical protein [Gemella palaticanis]MBF0715673.1 hypothetical protein [Gemella palaticanis]NYS47603.1 hypothetical protein [Gemella palaticanis]